MPSYSHAATQDQDHDHEHAHDYLPKSALVSNQARLDQLGLNAPKPDGKKGAKGGGAQEQAEETVLQKVERAKGWAKVSADDQTKVRALLSGTQNDMSKSASRRVRMTDLSAMSEDQQAAFISGLLTSKEARPDLSGEPVTATAVKYKLTGPVVEKDHAFRGSKANANVYKVEFEGGQTITIYAPAAPDPKLHYHTVEQAAEAAARLPEASRKVVRTVTLNPQVNPDDAYWAVQYNTPDFHSYMTAGESGDITVYPSKTGPMPTQDQMSGSMIHETGHTWSYKQWGSDTSKGGWVEWKKAMDSDKMSVSNYATSAIAEDVAETIQIYGSTKGKPAHDEYRTLVPARFKILDEQLK